MAVTTMQDLFGRDPIEDCRKQVRLLTKEDFLTRATAEINLKDGTKRIYRARAVNKKAAIKEILAFIKAVELATGHSVMWRLKGEKTFNIGATYNFKPSIFQQAKDALLGFFIELD